MSDELNSGTDGEAQDFASPDTYPETADIEGLQFYQGRWIATVEGEIVGTGDTALIADRHGRRNRARETLLLAYVEPIGGQSLPTVPVLDQLRPILAWQEEPVYLVGGAIRDFLFGLVPSDLDFMISGNATRLAFEIADKLGVPAFVLDRERDTARVVLQKGRMTLDFARCRGGSLEDDLYDRDFTVNSMAIPAVARTTASISDPFGGQADLRTKVIRQTHDDSIVNDPVRALRGVRLCHQLGFTIEDRTASTISRAAANFGSVSVERLRDELLKIFALAQPYNPLKQMQDLGILPYLLPEIASLQDIEQSPPHHEPVLNHTLSALRKLIAVEQSVVHQERTNDPVLSRIRVRLAPFAKKLKEHLDRSVDGGVDGWLLLRLGTLFHDVGKAATQERLDDGRIRFLKHDAAGATLTENAMRRLRMSRESIKHVSLVVNGHMRPLYLARAGHASRRAAFRLFRDCESAGLDIGLLALADQLSLEQGEDSSQLEIVLETVVKLYEYYFNHYRETIKPDLLVNGQQLMEELGLDPGPLIGELLGLIEEAQAAGEIHTVGEALNLARRHIT